MAKTRIFVIFKNDDMKFMEQLRAWDVDKEFDFFFEPALPRVPFHSAEGKQVKSELTEKIKTGTHLLCIIGKQTGDNDWDQLASSDRLGHRTEGDRRAARDALQGPGRPSQLWRNLGEIVHL